MLILKMLFFKREYSHFNNSKYWGIKNANNMVMRLSMKLILKIFIFEEIWDLKQPCIKDHSFYFKM